MPAPAAPPNLGTTSPTDFTGIDDLPGIDEPAAPAPAAKAATAPAAKAPVKPAAPAAPEPKKETTPEEDLEALPDHKEDGQAAPAAPTKAADEPTDEDPKTPAALRKAYQAAKAQVAAVAAEKATLQKQIAEAEKAGGEKATATLKAELEELRAERTKLDEQVKFLNYADSGEYKQKYQEPLTKAWESALGDIEGIGINENGETVKATGHHIQQLIGMPTGQAALKAQEWFGAAAMEMMAHRREILKLQTEGRAAIETWKKNGSEMRARQERDQEEFRSTAVSTFTKTISEMREGQKDVFGRPEDPDAAKFFDNGEKLTAIAFKGEGLDPGLTPAERSAKVVKAQAAVAARAAAFGPQRLALIRANERLAKLEKELADYKASEPKPDDVKKSAAVSGADDDIIGGINALPDYTG